jgi:hypothetical protein
MLTISGKPEMLQIRTFLHGFSEFDSLEDPGGLDEFLLLIGVGHFHCLLGLVYLHYPAFDECLNFGRWV